MTSSPLDRITSHQAVMFITNFIFGAGILTLPRTTTEKIKTPDSWIAVIVSGLIITLVAVNNIKTMPKIPERNFLSI